MQGTRSDINLQGGRLHTNTDPPESEGRLTQDVEVLEGRTAGSQLLDVRVTGGAVGGEEELAQTGQLPGQALEAAGAALQGGAPAQVELLQQPAAGRQVRQAALAQVLTAPQVQREQRAAARAQQAGHRIVVLDLRAAAPQAAFNFGGATSAYSKHQLHIS